MEFITSPPATGTTACLAQSAITQMPRREIGGDPATITLRASTPWGGTEIVEAAQTAGFEWENVPSPSGDLVLREPLDGSIFCRIDSMQFADLKAATGACTKVKLVLPFHTIKGSEHRPAACMGFVDRVHFAVQVMAEKLSASVVDADGDPMRAAVWQSLRWHVDAVLSEADAAREDREGLNGPKAQKDSLPAEPWRTQVHALVEHVEPLIDAARQLAHGDGNKPFARELLWQVSELMEAMAGVLSTGEPDEVYGDVILPAQALIIGAQHMRDTHPRITAVLQHASDALDLVASVLEEASLSRAQAHRRTGAVSTALQPVADGNEPVLDAVMQ